MAYDVTISGEPLRALFELTGALPEADVLPAAPGANRLTRAGGRILIRTGPARWLLMAPLAAEAALAEALPAAVLLSDTLSFFSINGAQADEVLAVATPLDLHPDVFAADAATFTEAFGIRALLRRLPDGFELAVDRSYADWFAEMLDRVAS